MPKGFSLQGFIDQGGFGFGEKGPIKLKAWVSKMLGERMAETRLAADQKLQPVADGFELTATLIDSWRLRWWILSKTGDIVVLGPKTLRTEIAKQLSEGAARYA
ncbi:MAG: WYL domain-containing protein [Pseudomonadota bacterium]|nr:WYL domain-containing protein [Pseudomonadota bacterium]